MVSSKIAYTTNMTSSFRVCDSGSWRNLLQLVGKVALVPRIFTHNYADSDASLNSSTTSDDQSDSVHTISISEHGNCMSSQGHLNCHHQRYRGDSLALTDNVGTITEDPW
jgi:hypothetical protein